MIKDLVERKHGILCIQKAFSTASSIFFFYIKLVLSTPGMFANFKYCLNKM